MTGPLRLNPSADILLSLFVGIRREEERCHTHQTLNFPLLSGPFSMNKMRILPGSGRDTEGHRETKRQEQMVIEWKDTGVKERLLKSVEQ